jgi:hypothetical protein
MRWTVGLIAAALVAKDAAGAPRLREPLLSLVDLLPDWLVDAGYEAIARGLHVGIAVAAAVMLATALALAAALRRTTREKRQHADTPRRFDHPGRSRSSAENPPSRVAVAPQPQIRA